MKNSAFPRMHVSLYVSDINKTVDFYNSFFGQEANKIKPSYAKYILEEPSLIISFVENKERVRSNFGHLGFQVETEQELFDRMKTIKARRIDTLEEMGTNCCYAKQDKFWVSDPDGHQWEVYYFHEDSAFNDPGYALSDTSNCCMPNSNTETSETQKQKAQLSELQGQSCEPGSGCC